MLFYIDNFMKLVLLPPGINIVIFFIGYFSWRYRPNFAKFMLISSMLSLWLLSTPFIAQALINYLQYSYPALSFNNLTREKNTAIVVLEAGLNMQTPEYGRFTVSEKTLSRLRYTAFLYHYTGAPILVSGHDPSNSSVNQATFMANALREYFNVPTRWKEEYGFNTAQEGRLSIKILKDAGISKIYLVTHAFHMPRSIYAFQNKGIEVIPASTGYKKLERPLGAFSAILPSMEALNVSVIALNEYLGIAWYKLYYPMLHGNDNITKRI